MTSRNIGSSILNVVIVSDTKGLKKGMGEAGQASASLGNKWKLLGQAAAAYLAFQAVRAVKQFVGDTRRAFIDLNESTNAVNRIFGDLAPQIHAIGAASADSMGLSRAAFNSAAVAMSSFARNVAGPGGDVVGTLEDLMRRAVDFASVVNIDVQEALDIFQSTLAGQSRPIRRFGKDISDAAVQQFALAEGIVSVGEKMTEHQKQTARYGLLMKETSEFAGDFAATQDELANASRRAEAAMEDAKASVGRALQSAFMAAIPVVSRLAQGIDLIGIRVAQLQGHLEGAEAALRLFEAQTGRGVRTGADFVELLGRQNLSLKDDGPAKYAAAINALVKELGFNEDQLRDLVAVYDATGERVGVTAEEMELLRQVVQGKLDTGDWAKLPGLFDDLGEGADEVEEKTRKATTALERFEAQVRSQFDPLHRLRSAQAGVAEAQQRVTDVYNNAKSTEREKLDALFDLETKNRDLQAAQLAVGSGSAITAAQYKANLRSMGTFTDEQIDAMVADFRRLNAFTFAEKRLIIQGEYRRAQGLPGGVLQGFQHGGRPKRGEPAIVGEKGPEIFVPDTAGTIVPNGKNKGTPVGLNPIIINVTVQGSITTERELAVTLAAGVRDELLRMQRRNGSVLSL